MNHGDIIKTIMGDGKGFLLYRIVSVQKKYINAKYIGYLDENRVYTKMSKKIPTYIDFYQLKEDYTLLSDLERLLYL